MSPRAIYRDVQTISGQKVFTRECDCDIARKERMAGKEPHRAYALEKDFRVGMNQMICSKTNMTVWV